jgi:hypothetical protein
MRRSEPEVIYRNGKPAAVILDIDKYEELLERVEDIDDLRALREMRKRPVKFRRLEDFLSEYPQCSASESTMVKDAQAGASRVRRLPRRKRRT